MSSVEHRGAGQWLGLAWSVGLLLCAGACREPDRGLDTAAPVTDDVVLDLAATFAAATVSVEKEALEIGRPSARPHLIAGWGADEEDEDGAYVWGLGEASTLELFAVAPADLVLDLRCRPFHFAGAPEQIVKLLLNGEAIGEVRLDRSLERYQIAVPARAVKGGVNRLVFRYAYHHSPRDVVDGAVDERSLAVRWYDVAFRGLGAGAVPSPRETAGGTGERLEIPVGTAVSYYFDAEGRTELAIPALRAWGRRAGAARLFVRTRSGDVSGQRSIDPRRVAGPVRIPLSTAGPAIDRVELAVTASGEGGLGARAREWLGGAGESGVSLAAPVIRRLEPPARHGAEIARRPPQRPNIVVYLIDTLRADHLGVYGYERPTSPNIDRFAADAVLFTAARAQSSWTRPAVVTLLTGLLPQSHGVEGRADVLPDSVGTLAEILAGEGYETVGVVTNGNVGATFGLDQGFDHFRHLSESSERTEMHRLSDHLNEWVFRWLAGREDAGRPFFLYAHATDPHLPYTPPEPFLGRFAAGVDPSIGLRENARAITEGREAPEDVRAALVDLYDGEIAFNDHHFGRLLDHLTARGLYDSSLIVLVADHGEEFLDHGGWEHGKTLYSEQLHVPLIVKLPGGEAAGTRVETTAGQVDVLPTILDVLAVEAPAGLDGVSLLRNWTVEGRPSFASLNLGGRHMRSVGARGWKLILDSSDFTHSEPVELYHLAADPRETEQLSRERPFEREFLSQVLGRLDLERVAVAGTEAEIPEELRKQLEALGYL